MSESTASPSPPPVQAASRHFDVVIVGGGQAALATAWFLRRSNLDFILLDAEEGPGGAWRHGWDSLRLFSPSEWSSIAGWQMAPKRGYPTREDVVDYLTRYDERYQLPVIRPCRVSAVEATPEGFTLRTSQGDFFDRCVVSATGTWRSPHVPAFEGAAEFAREQLHSASYRPFALLGHPRAGRRRRQLGGPGHRGSLAGGACDLGDS